MPFPEINTLRHAEVLAFGNFYRLLADIHLGTLKFGFHNYLLFHLPTNRGCNLVLSLSFILY